MPFPSDILTFPLGLGPQLITYMNLNDMQIHCKHLYASSSEDKLMAKFRCKMGIRSSKEG